MSDDFDDNDEGIKSLRKAYEKLQTQLADSEKEKATLAAKDRTRSIADKLKDLGAKPGLAEFVPSSVGVDSLGQWLAEKADLFGFKVQEDSADNAEEAASQSRISGLGITSPLVDDQPDMTAIKAATTMAELDKLIYNRLSGTG